jgi:malate dehydrogenase
MTFIAIIGAGPMGGSLAYALAVRDRVREIRLIDVDERVARGKALDISQSAPVEGFNTILTSAGATAAASGADAVVLADAAGGEGEPRGEPGLALLRQIAAIEGAAPIVCAGASQADLIARAAGELHLPPSRVFGSAPIALESALRAIAGLEIDVSGTEISLRVLGVPPRSAFVAWEEASASGQPLASQIAPHQIAALSSRIPALWPPGPYALASAAARVVEALSGGSRRRFSCLVSLGRGRVAAMPVELGPAGIVRVIEPVLTPLERTLLENGIESSASEGSRGR